MKVKRIKAGVKHIWNYEEYMYQKIIYYPILVKHLKQNDNILQSNS